MGDDDGTAGSAGRRVRVVRVSRSPQRSTSPLRTLPKSSVPLSPHVYTGKVDGDIPTTGVPASASPGVEGARAVVRRLRSLSVEGQGEGGTTASDLGRGASVGAVATAAGPRSVISVLRSRRVPVAENRNDDSASTITMHDDASSLRSRDSGGSGTSKGTVPLRGILKARAAPFASRLALPHAAALSPLSSRSLSATVGARGDPHTDDAVRAQRAPSPLSKDRLSAASPTTRGVGTATAVRVDRSQSPSLRRQLEPIPQQLSESQLQRRHPPQAMQSRPGWRTASRSPSEGRGGASPAAWDGGDDGSVVTLDSNGRKVLRRVVRRVVRKVDEASTEVALPTPPGAVSVITSLTEPVSLETRHPRSVRLVRRPRSRSPGKSSLTGPTAFSVSSLPLTERRIQRPGDGASPALASPNATSGGVRSSLEPPLHSQVRLRVVRVVRSRSPNGNPEAAAADAATPVQKRLPRPLK